MTTKTVIGIAASTIWVLGCSAEMSGGTGYRAPDTHDGGPVDAGTSMPAPLAPPPSLAPPPTTRPTGPATPAGASEACGNGLDDDRNGRIDDGCGCDPGATQRCYPGDPAAAGVGPCVWGSQRCEGDVEFPSWSTCEGAVGPVPETCNDVDDDCDGAVDDGLDCRPPAPPPPPPPAPPPPPPPAPCLDAEGSPWQQWLDTRVHCFGEDLDENPDEFEHASIPAPGASVWRSRGALGIDFSDDSTIPGELCDGAHTGGVFTYFQTFVTLSSAPSRFVLRNGGTDDGVQVWIFNSRYPAGRTSDAWTFFESGGVADLTAHAVVGENRIVLIHIDDNPTHRALYDVRLEIAGGRLGDCR